MTERDLAIRLGEHYLGTWYSWGGDDPMAGFDCSGFVIEVLTACGRLPRGYDSTAKGLYNRIASLGGASPKAGAPGSLVFWSSTEDASGIRHVEMIYAIIAGKAFSIGASGGGSRTITKEDAIRDNAFVKIRPVDGRSGHVLFADPFVT
jgi:cell wall-associated NlpC family hydrolase